MRNRYIWAMILAVACVLAGFMAFLTGVRAEWKPEYAQATPEVRDWYKNAEITPEAQKRFSWKKCCDHSDVVRTQFKKVGGGEWWYMAPEGWKRVPPDIIHWFNSAPNGEPTLFIYAGQETCFFPPNAGI